MSINTISSKFPASIINNPSIKGELATIKVMFGPFHRYAIAAVHSRFDAVSWFVWDAEKADKRNYDPTIGYAPSVIRIASTIEDAISGLDI